jgi:hypothetical protein
MRGNGQGATFRAQAIRYQFRFKAVLIAGLPLKRIIKIIALRFASEDRQRLHARIARKCGF